MRIKNDTKYQVYEGYVINAPEVRMDLIDKKVTWILKKRNDFQVMLKDDTVYLRGIIKHRSLNESQKGKKRRNEYYIDHVLISKVEQNNGFFENIRRKLIRTLMELKIRMLNTRALSMLCYLAIDHGWVYNKKIVQGNWNDALICMWPSHRYCVFNI